MILYTKTASGKIYTWEIDKQSYGIEMSYGELNGSKTNKIEHIIQGKQTRTIEEQVNSRFASRVKKMRDRGYVDTIEEAMQAKTNALGLKKPMLAHKFQDHEKKVDWNNAFIQYKYDGHRCIVTRHCGEVIAYSRNGKMIHTIDHILSMLDWAWFEEGMALDGELYIHGKSLQSISSLVKREQADSKNLVYVLYDIMEDVSYVNRLYKLTQIGLSAFGPIQLATTRGVSNKDDALAHMMMSKHKGYEGSILRHGKSGYEDGKRSQSLLKLKTCVDAEFLIAGVTKSKDGWGILNCLTEDGREFSVNPPGTLEDRFMVYNNQDSFIGKMARVEFANLTQDGIPFHPVCTDIT